MIPRFVNRPHALVIAAAFVAIVGLYTIAARNNQFVYDDLEVIVRQSAPQSVGDVARIFCERHFPVLNYYRPITRTTLLLQKTIHGDHPFPFHAANAVLAGFVFVVAYAFLRLPVFRIRPEIALLAAAVFILHPIASECVYPAASGRETLLPAFFCLCAIYAFLREGPRWYLAGLASFAAALLCKEQAVMLPFVLVVADYLGLSSVSFASGSKNLWRYGPVGLILLVYFSIRTAIFHGAGIQLDVGNNPFGILESVIYALQSMVAPFVSLTYEPPVEVWLSLPRILLSIGVAIGLGFLVQRVWSDIRPVVWFGFAWFLLFQLPTSHIVKQEAPFSERYIFLSALGLILIVASVISIQWEKSALRAFTIPGAIALVLVSASISFHRGSYYADEVTFHTQWLRTNPKAVNAHNGLGTAMSEQGRTKDALEHFTEALKLKPDSPWIHNNIGKTLMGEGRYVDALPYFLESLRLKPDFADAHNNLGFALAEVGRAEEAIAHYNQAIHLDRRFVDAHNNLGVELAKKGRLREAEAEFREAIRLNHDLVSSHVNLSLVLSEQGDQAGAIQQYREVLRLKPDWDVFKIRLAWLLSTAEDPRLRDGTKALQLMLEVRGKSSSPSIEALDAQAAAYAESGEFVEAVATAEQALALVRTKGPESLIGAIQGRLALYRQGQAFHSK